MVVFNLSFVTLLLCALSAVSVAEKVNVTLYYESLCPPCLGFIRGALTTEYPKVKDYVNLELIPYGNSKTFSIGSIKFVVCQHGPDECYGDRFHACAIQNNPTDVWLGFIICTVTNGHAHNVTHVKQCAEQFNLPWDKLRTCADGDEGEDLILNYGEITAKAQTHYAPHININGIHDRMIEQSIYDHFVDTICSYLREKPDVCE